MDFKSSLTVMHAFDNVVIGHPYILFYLDCMRLSYLIRIILVFMETYLQLQFVIAQV
jgi:hypothetical protein